ncbi:hypothetical protein SASPL_153456 [Salvia splendens]|uniref:Cation/H+ exchanger domain-containing protein n=1 Tax=Salvia splendens TaxID=180675 RepID=A0A8X8W5U4_SALSN|nr:hypothetical protein SASPL_153456 [Salvia splendens]
MGVALSITAFPVLARILAELKLLTTDVGRMAMSAAAVNDVAAWVLLALAIALSGTGHSPLVSVWVFLCGFGFVFVCILVAPPVFKWMARRCPEGEQVDEIYICATLAAVLAASLVTDTIGIHALFGAFVVGVLVPKEGPFAGALVEKVEDLVSVVGPSGSRDHDCVHREDTWHGRGVYDVQGLVFGVVHSWFLDEHERAGRAHRAQHRERPRRFKRPSFRYHGVDGVVHDVYNYPGGYRLAIYKPARMATTEYKHRTIQRKETSTQLRILACFQSSRTVPTLINLMEISRGTGRSGRLRVYAMHLMELSERSSVILMVHKVKNNGIPFFNKEKAPDSTQVVVAFEAFHQLSHVSISPATEISPMMTMHQDICTSTEAKRASVIVLPFHKHVRLDGHLETTREEMRHVNRRVLECAPCSVAILIDRGLGGTAHVPASNVDYTITAFFFGGPDDREAVAYGALMAEHPGIRMNAVRVHVDPKVAGGTVKVDVGGEEDGDAEARSADEDFIADFKDKVPRDGSIKFEDTVVKDAAEAVEVIKAHKSCNLFLVGRISEGELAAALKQKRECPELGPVGNLLISPEISTTASVLVVQQYRSKLTGPSLTSLKEEDDDASKNADDYDTE